MKTEDIEGRRPSKWVPLTELQELAALGKLGEEAGELVSIICRTIIQGGTQHKDPETGVTNGDNLQDEIADVIGLCRLVARIYGFDTSYIEGRAKKKFDMKMDWLRMLRE